MRTKLSSVGVCALLLTVAAVGTVVGCGGGGGADVPPPASAPTRGGQVRFTIRWPEKSSTRLIPRAAESIRLRCLEADDADELILERAVARGESVVTLDLPSVKVKIVAEACAEADGTGQVLAKGSVTLQVPEAQVAEAKLALDSVIKEVRVSPAAVDLWPGQVVAVSADAYDESGAVVLTDPDGWEWAPEDEVAARKAVEYRATGYLLSLKAKHDGACAFTVTEKDTGKTARLSVVSRGGPHPTPSPTPDPIPEEPGLYLVPGRIEMRAGDYVELSGVYRHRDGSLQPVEIEPYSGRGVRLLDLPDGKVGVVALYPCPDGVAAAFSYVPGARGGSASLTPVTGRLVSGEFLRSEGAAAPSCAVYLDGALLGTFTDRPNALGKPLGVSLFRCTPEPGPHRLKVVHLSEDRSAPAVSVRVRIPIREPEGREWVGFDADLPAGEAVEQEVVIPPDMSGE